jgi:hypothetical protein
VGEFTKKRYARNFAMLSYAKLTPCVEKKLGFDQRRHEQYVSPKKKCHARNFAMLSYAKLTLC